MKWKERDKRPPLPQSFKVLFLMSGGGTGVSGGGWWRFESSRAKG